MTSADAAHRRRGAPARGWRAFRRWRRGRPFWAGLFTILAGLQVFASTQLTLSGFQLKIGLEGFLSYVIPLVLVLCGLLIWLTPQHRVFYGVIAAVVALYSFIGVNFGGFFLGMLFGIIGGSLAVAWTPVKPTPPAEAPEEVGGGPADAEAAPDGPGRHGQRDATVDELFTGPLTDVLPRPVNPLAQPAPGAHRYEEESPPRHQVDDTQHIPGQWRGDDQQREEEQSRRDPGNGTGPLPRRTPKLFVIALIPLVLTAAAFASLRGVSPARAAPAAPYPSPCPATPSASAKPKPSSTRPSPADQSPETTGPTRTPRAEASAGPSAPDGPSESPSPSPSPESTEDRGLIGDLLDGLGDLLGIGEDETPSPSTTPSTTPSAGTGDGSQAPEPDGRPSPAKPTKSASASSKPTSSADCVEVEAKQLAADGVPVVQKVPDQMLGTKLTLSGFAFDGVTELNTAGGGTIRVLQFSMDRAITDDFELRVPGPGDLTTSLTSSALTVERAEDAGQKVKFYCSRFSGKLAVDIFGVELEIPIPLTFTPDFPPPLTFERMVFTDIDIALVFVDSDVLKAPNLNTKVGT